jgi:hypothetical protein
VHHLVRPALARRHHAAVVTRAPAPRALLDAAVGLLALAAGIALGAVPLALDGLAPVPLLWAALGAAGLVLVAIAVAEGVRGRGWGVRALVVLGVLAALQWVVVPAVTAGNTVATRHPGIPPAASLGLAGARQVTFPAADGTRLSGWLVPGRTGAAVVLLHGSHGTRLGVLAHLRMLAPSGATLLAYDARGHGRSAGGTNALGWRGADDLAGAVAFLAGRPGVDPDRISALGLSMGAETALRATAEGVPLAGVVADGAGASTVGDIRSLASGPTAAVEVSSGWAGMRLAEVLSGDDEPAALTAIAGRIRAPVLLVSAGVAGEREMAGLLAGRTGTRAARWHVPEAAHTGALAARPAAYRARVEAALGLGAGRLSPP